MEKNGQILRVAFAKSVLGPGSGASVPSQSSSLAAAAIEAATFAQQVIHLLSFPVLAIGYTRDASCFCGVV